MKNILVTGGAGYIGSHAVRALADKRYKVVVLDNLSKGYRQAVDKRAYFVRLDLSDKTGLENLFKTNSFDAVLHFAGSIEVGLSMEDPGLFFENNFLNGLNLLEAMRKNKVHNIIFSSTAAVYGNPAEIPIKEETITNPTNFYGQSKLFFEQLLGKYNEFYGFKYIALRYFNAAGADLSGEIGQAYQPDTHLISRMLKTALGLYDNLKIFGTDYQTSDGTCIRDYIHVTDLVEAHLLGLEYLFNKQESQIFNLGNGSGFSVREVIKAAEEVTGLKIKIEESGRREGDPPLLIADSAKAKKLLGWETKYSDLPTIIGSAWKWYQSHPKGYFRVSPLGKLP